MTIRTSFAIGLAAGALLALGAAVAGAQCPTVPVRQQTDTLLAEFNRPQGARKSVGVRLTQRIRTLCPTTEPVPVPVPVPAPPPPPDPVALPTPTGISPGSSTAPGPVVSQTPTFNWSQVSGATGYVLAIRNTTTDVIVYPSASGVGPPIAGTSLTLPSGVLSDGAAYRWDVTAVNATSKSLASANRYFTTAPAA